jgi:hypothetical protein
MQSYKARIKVYENSVMLDFSEAMSPEIIVELKALASRHKNMTGFKSPCKRLTRYILWSTVYPSDLNVLQLLAEKSLELLKNQGLEENSIELTGSDKVLIPYNEGEEAVNNG